MCGRRSLYCTALDNKVSTALPWQGNEEPVVHDRAGCEESNFHGRAVDTLKSTERFYWIWKDFTVNSRAVETLLPTAGCCSRLYTVHCRTVETPQFMAIWFCPRLGNSDHTVHGRAVATLPSPARQQRRHCPRQGSSDTTIHGREVPTPLSTAGHFRPTVHGRTVETYRPRQGCSDATGNGRAVAIPLSTAGQ